MTTQCDQMPKAATVGGWVENDQHNSFAGWKKLSPTAAIIAVEFQWRSTLEKQVPNTSFHSQGTFLAVVAAESAALGNLRC